MNLFSRFFQENQEKFLAFAYSYLRDKAEAEDVVMESMIALWENRDRWEEREAGEDRKSTRLNSSHPK